MFYYYFSLFSDEPSFVPLQIVNFLWETIEVFLSFLFISGWKKQSNPASFATIVNGISEPGNTLHISEGRENAEES